MANRLTKLTVDEVSCVDKAANGKKFLILKRATEPVEKVIKQEGSKWVIYSEDGTKKLGTYDTKKEATDRLAEIEGFGHQKVTKGTIMAWVLQGLRKAAGSSGPKTEVDEMTAEEIKKAIEEGATEVLAPLSERIEKLEAAVAEPVASAAPEVGDAASAVVAKKEEEGEPAAPAAPSAEDIQKMVKGGLGEALKPLEERIGKLEGVAGERQSALDQDGAHQVSKNAGFWEGSGLLL